MLRASLLRSRSIASVAVGPRAGPQWLAAQRASPAGLTQRFFATGKKPDETVLPGSESAKAADDIPPPPPLTTPANPSLSDTIPPEEAPKIPPSPEAVGSKPASSSTSGGASRSAPTIPPETTPPTGTGSASVAPDPIIPRKKPRRFRRFLLYTLILTALGYGGGVYYSLSSDNFHDFFTEYVPFGEDAVAYFEEREFKKRFPGNSVSPRLHAQVRGENKVSIPSKAGISPRLSEDDERKQSDLAMKGRHVSAVEESKPKHTPEQVQAAAAGEKPADSNTLDLLPKDAVKPDSKDKAVKESKKEPKRESKKEPVQEPAKPEPQAVQAALIDNLTVKDAEEPVVQEVVQILNNIITVINADNASGKYSSTIAKAKEDISKVINDISTMKALTEKTAEDKIRSTHMEFDNAAKELLRRVEAEMHDQETRWKEEYEAEREKLAQAYQNKLKSELEAAQNVYDQRLKNELLEQSIALQRQFANTVRDRVEAERSGRLGKLTELSDKLAELEKLTSEWNQVVDANLKTQHLIVAVEAVRATLENADRPKPFIEELAALKEVAADDAVVNAAIASINPTAYQRGIPTSAQLIDRFRRVASEVRKAALLPENAGIASHIASLALSKVMFKKQGLPTGDDVESVLTRTEVLLEEGDLDAAAREMNGLHGWAKVLARDWLGEVRRVLEVKQALDVIATEARLQSLLVD